MFTDQLDGSQAIEAELYDRIVAATLYIDIYRYQPFRLTSGGELVTPEQTVYFTRLEGFVSDWLEQHPADRVFVVDGNRDKVRVDEWQRHQQGWLSCERGEAELKVSRAPRKRLSPLAG